MIPPQNGGPHGPEPRPWIWLTLLLGFAGGVVYARSQRRPAKRDHFRYVFKEENRIVHRGLTKDPQRREREHRRCWPTGKLVQVGPAVSKVTGLAWERKGGKPH